MARRRKKKGTIAGFMGAIRAELPIVMKSQALEAAEVAALFLDRSTRRNLNRSGTSTGALARSWEATILEDQSGVLVGAGAFSDLPYAFIHETGGVIRPKRAKALAVPLTPEARKAGSPRNMPNLSFMPRGKRAPILYEGFKTHFVLPKKVTIPRTGYITEAAEKAAPVMMDIIGRGVFSVMSRAGNKTLKFEK